MENWSKWQLIKIGFWSGIGFVIPTFIAIILGTVFSMTAIPFMMKSAFDSEEAGVISDFTDDFDISDQIRIENYKEQKNGDQLLILGSIKNSSDKNASSIQLEAELKDKDGNLVYECSEYISKKLKPEETESFQIKCGCGEKPIPVYNSVTVRVVSASRY